MMLLLAVLTTTAWAQSEEIFAGFTATDGTPVPSAEDDEGEGYASLVDGLFSEGDQGTDWTKWGTTEKGTPQDEDGQYYWVEFYSEAPINVASYILTTGNDNASYNGRNPKSWVLKAKLNEDDPWTAIATVTNDETMEDQNFTSYEFDLDAPGTYQYFRFMISELRGEGNFMQLCELRFRALIDHTNIKNATITGLQYSYFYTGNAISINYTVTASDGTVLNSTDHYDAVITKDGNPVTEVKDEGTYTLTITGKGDYTGTKSVTFIVDSVLMIGNPESTKEEYTLPIHMWYKHALSQQIYTAAEIGTAGTITAISFDYTHSEAFSLEGVQVFMMQVDKDAFANNTDMVALDNATQVYEGTFAANGAGWVTVNLDTPFDYDGTSNLLVCFYYPNTANVKEPGTSYTFRTTETTEHLAIIYYSDSQIPSIEDVSTFSGYMAYYNYRNNIKLDITPETVTVCPRPTSITVSDITLDGATVTWESDGDAWNIGLKAPGDANYTIVAAGLTEKTYTLSGLAENTKYSVGVQTACGAESVSSFRSTTFTTSNPCAAPTNLVISDQTPTSATLSWTAGYQETSWTVKYKEASATEYMTETVSSPTITLSDLKGLTKYDVRIYNCTDEGADYLSGSFTTPTAIPLIEEFDASSIPTGWAMYMGKLADNGTASLTSYPYAWKFSTGNGVFDSHAQLNIYSNNQKWLVTPPLLMEDNVQLSFDIALTAYSGTDVPAPQTTGTDDKFVVLISTDNMATWTILRQWDNQEGAAYVFNDIANTATGEHVILDLSSYAGQSVILAFYGESTESNADNNLHIDNVSIEHMSAYARPTNLTVSNTTHNAATLGWTENGSATSWQICLNGDEENLITVTENPYTLTDLATQTAYTAKVRALGNDGNSEWSKDISFSTTAEAEEAGDSWSDDFEGDTCGWQLFNGALTNAWAWGTAASTDGTNHTLYISNDGGTTNAYTGDSPAKAYAAKLLHFTEGKHQFAYNWRANGENTYDFLRVALVPGSETLTASEAYSSIGYKTLPAGWIALDGGNKLNLASEWQSQQISANVPDGNYYLVFVWRNDNSASYNPPAAVDNVSITRFACQGDVEDLALSAFTSTSATLSWTAGDATQWQVAYSSNASFEGATEVIVDEPTYTLTELQPEATYYVRARIYCGGEDYGEWCDVVSFEPTDKWVVGSGTSTDNYLPTCTYYKHSLTEQIYTTDELGTAALIESIDFYYTATELTRNLDIYMVGTDKVSFESTTDWVSVTAADLVYSGDVTFVQNGWTSIQLDHVFLYDGESNVVLVVDDNTGNDLGISYFRAFDAPNQAIRIAGDGTNYDPTAPSAYTGNVSSMKNRIRLMKIELSDCTKPTQLAATEIGPDFATLSWKENGNATEWVVAYQAEGETEYVEVVADATTCTLAGLVPATTYTVRVRPACDENQWSATISITTLAATPAPTDVTVSDITPTTATVSWTGYCDSYNVYVGADEVTDLFNTDFSDPSDLNSFTNSQDYPWTVIVVSGNAYIQSTNAGTSSSTSSIIATVTYPEGGGTIEFDAQCMGEGTSNAYDKCQFFIDDEPMFAKGANGEQWDHYIYEVAAGEHTFTWSYSKDSNINPTGDYFAVDNLVMNGFVANWSDPVTVTNTEYTFEDLTPMTDYRVKVEGFNGEETSEASELVGFTTTETASITFAKEGYATYYNSQRVVVLPAGMKARIVTTNGQSSMDNGQSITYETIADGDGDTKTVAPATAMMLQVAPANDAKTIDITLTKAPAMYVQWAGNLLHGSDEATTTTGNADDARFYKLSYNKSGTDIGWYWGTADGSAFTSAAHKAWLALPAAAGARSFLSLPDYYDSQVSTAIDDMPTALDNENGTWYSINGVKLDGQPTRKGLYIVNGQKKVVK